MSEPYQTDRVRSLADWSSLASSYDGSSVDLLFGHSVSLVFENGSHQVVRQRALDAMADYFRKFAKEINFYFPYGARAPQPIGDVDVIAFLQRHLDGLPHGDAVGLDDDV